MSRLRSWIRGIGAAGVKCIEQPRQTVRWPVYRSVCAGGAALSSEALFTRWLFSEQRHLGQRMCQVEIAQHTNNNRHSKASIVIPAQAVSDRVPVATTAALRWKARE